MPRRAPLLLLLVSLLVALGAGLVRAQRSEKGHAFAVEIRSTTSGRAQVYFDVGRGLSEPDSISTDLPPSDHFRELVLPLPEGRYTTLRFDPLNRPGTVTFRNARIVSPAGQTVRLIRPDEFAANDHIDAYVIEPDGTATVCVKAERDDPNLTLPLVLPLELKREWSDMLLLQWREMVAAFLFSLAAGAGLVAGWHGRDRIERAAKTHPKLALAMIATIAGLSATYPVVLAGKSFVSPNITALLRQSPPTIPGLEDVTQTDLHAADPAVALWQNVPYSAIQHDALFRHGELPLWNRYASCGLTLIGQGQSMFGDPLHVFVIAARGASWAWDAKFVIARILFALGVALAVWVSTRDLAAAAIAAIAAPFVGFFNFRFNHPAVFTLCYSPWILVAWLLLARAQARRAWHGGLGLLALANGAVFASGTVKEAFALLLVLNLVGFASWVFSDPSTTIRKPTQLVLIALTFVSTAAILAPVWVPFVTTLQHASTAYEMPVVWQAPRAWVIGLFDSLFYVELSPSHRGFLPAANLVFALGACFAVFRSPRAWRQDVASTACFVGLVGAIAIAHEFVPRAWILATPFLRNVYHIHNTFSVVAVVLLTVLGGCGFHLARTRLTEPKAWTPALLGGVLMLVLAAIYFRDLPATWTGNAGIAGWWAHIPDHAFFYLNLGGMIAGCAGLVFAARARLTTGRSTATATVVVAACLVVLLYRHGLHLDAAVGRSYLTYPMTRADLSAPSPALEAAREHARGEPFRVVGTDLNLIASWNAMYGIEGINGPDALMNRAYRELITAAELAPKDDWRVHLTPPALGRVKPILDFLGVAYVVSDAAELPASGYQPLHRADLAVYRSEGTWPRAFFSTSVVSYSSVNEFLNEVRQRKTPFAAVELGDTTLPPELDSLLAQANAAYSAAPATHYEVSANTTTFRIHAPSPGIAVLHETWFPGSFRATVDGHAAPVFRVNHAFKGVFLTKPGDHVVQFTYEPPLFTAALWSAFGGTLVLAAVLLGARRWDHRGQD